jgi:hypothetical protein
VRVLAAGLAAVVLAGTAAAGVSLDASRYLINQRNSGAGFHEPGRAASPGLTAWAILGLRAAGHCPTQSGDYLKGKPYPTATDLELRILALDALRSRCAFNVDLSGQVAQLQRLKKANGRIGKNVNSTIWGILALRATGRSVGRKPVAYVKKQQRPSGGWSWAAGGKADSNDTAAALQALRSVGVGRHTKIVNRAVRYLRSLQNPNGGFELTAGRGSDTQSTAWAIQGLLAAGRSPGKAAFGYLKRMQRANGSFRYNARYVTTPVWVTSQALAAWSRKTFPLK